MSSQRDRAMQIVKDVPVPTHFSHRGFSDQNAHQWESSNFVIDTLPEIYHRHCVSCGLVQQQSGDSGWQDDLTDTLNGYRRRLLKALEQGVAD